MRQWSTQAKIDIPSDVATDPVISYDLVKSRIKTLVRKASRERATAPIQDYFHTLLTLESALLADYFLQDSADSIVDSQDMKETVRQSQELFGELEVNLENSLISAYQSMHDKAQIFIDEDSLAFNYLVRYRQLAKVEAEFAKLTGCRVDGLDILEDAVAVAKKVISDFGLQIETENFQGGGPRF